MCRVDLALESREMLAQLLIDIRDALCNDMDADPADVRIGPVDFGPVDEEER